MAVIGASPALTYVPTTSQAFSGNGSQTIFTLNTSVAANADIEVLVDNVQQSPFDGSYTAGGTTLTFSEAPATGTNNIYVVYRAVRIVATTQMIPDNGSVTSAKLSGDLTTPGNLSVTGTVEINGGSGSIGLTLKNGGDLLLKNADNTGSAVIYCDTDSEVKTSSSVTASGFKLGSELKTSWGKSVKQVQTGFAAAGITTVNSTTPTTIMSVSITVAAGSTVYITAQGEQNAVGDGWQWHRIYRGDTALGTTAITVTSNTWNEEFHHSYWDTNLSAGTYVYNFKVWNGSNYSQYGEHSTPMIQVVEFGV